jgi:hypothetical protein
MSEITADLFREAGVAPRLVVSPGRDRPDEMDAGPHVRLDDVRVGRDLALYGIARIAGGYGAAFAMLAEEVFLAIRDEAPDLYHALLPGIRALDRYLLPEHKQRWHAIWEDRA